MTQWSMQCNPITIGDHFIVFVLSYSASPSPRCVNGYCLRNKRGVWKGGGGEGEGRGARAAAEVASIGTPLIFFCSH